MDKVIVDLDHSVWLEEGGFGPDSVSGLIEGPKCAIGKFNVASGLLYGQYFQLGRILNDNDSIETIWRTNDSKNANGTYSQLNHQKAVRLLLEELAKHPDKVEFKGSIALNQCELYEKV